MDLKDAHLSRRPPLSLPLTLECWLEHWYPWIVEFLDLSSEDDLNAIDWFFNAFPNGKYSSLNLEALIKDHPVIICGCGPSLEEDLDILLKKRYIFPSPIIIAADGATRPLLDNGLLPDIIVTDADGDQQSIISANQKKSIVICHLHGDNHKAILDLVPKLLPSLILFSIQTEPISHFLNFLGFTDGDRAAFIAAQNQCLGICLLGFDLGEYIGKYSKPTFNSTQRASTFKRRKLIIARELLSWLAAQTKIPIINCSAQSEAIPLVKAIPLHRLTCFPPK